MLTGALSSGGTLPFWMSSNQFGLMPEHSGALAVLQADTQFDTSKAFQWRWGVSLAANYDKGPVLPEGTADFSVMVDELYASARWKMFSIDAGMKHDPIDFYASSRYLGSLSTTSGHVAASSNARSMPGYMINLDPVPIPFTGRHVWFYANFGDYVTLDQRYVQGALVHRTKFGFKFNITKRLDFTLGLDHYGIWAGESPLYGKMPVTFDNYFRVITGHGASSSGTISDQLNVIGDQGGGEIWRFDYRGEGWKATFLHDVPYNDGSGMGLGNFPDGVNTLWFGFDNKDRWVSDVVYEFIYSRNQSGWYHDRPTTEEERAHLDPSDQYHYWHHIRGGGDNYFNNGEYRSGWTHFGRTIGLPLFVPTGTHDGTWTGHGIVLGVENTRIRAHHAGVSGKIMRKYPYKLMLTYSQNYGTYNTPYLGESPWNKEPGTVEEFPLHQVSGAFMGEIPMELRGGLRLDITYGIYADRGELLPDLFGATLGLRISL